MKHFACIKGWRMFSLSTRRYTYNIVNVHMTIIRVDANREVHEYMSLYL